MREITIKELKKLSEEQYRLVDIRNESNTIYGIIPGAINIPADKFAEADELSLEKLDIFKSVENVNLNTVIAYKKDGVRHHFLEDYNGE